MSRLSVSGDALHARARTMRTIVTDLTTAGAQADVAADAVGQAQLASAIHDFAHDWNTHRTHAIEALRGLADAFDAVNDTFADLEGDMAAQLREATATAQSALRAAAEGPGA